MRNTTLKLIAFSLSVRRDPRRKPIIIFGQDESVFNQYSFNGKQWVGSDGKRAILPKSNGMGLMISAFQSREFGFGYDLTSDKLEEALKKANENRKGQDYEDKRAATKVHGTAKKSKLKSNPFIVEFEFGSMNGYWTGSHMICQTEDCIDFLRAIHGDAYDFKFLYDHSSGHVLGRQGGLVAKDMNKGWGGKQGSENMRDSTIESNDWFGPFWVEGDSRYVQTGRTHTMVYKSEWDKRGPYELTEDKREAAKFDRKERLEKATTPNKTKAELVDELIHRMPGIENKEKLMKRTVKHLHDYCDKLGIEKKKTVTTKTTKGWWGQNKGLYQVCVERGWANPEEKHKYKVIATDTNGDILPDYSLLHLVENFPDFKNETSQLEHICSKLGCEAIITTKYHAEFAGEGIEYTWGLSKLHFRRYPLEQKDSKLRFHELVRKCISPEILTKDVVRRFSRRARSYMIAYRILEDDVQNKRFKQSEISHHRIEHMKKSLKCHRAAIDFDKSFIMSYVKDEEFDFEQDLERTIKKERGVVIPVKVEKVEKGKSKAQRPAPQLSPDRRPQSKQVRIRSPEKQIYNL